MRCQYSPEEALLKLNPKSVRQLPRDFQTTKARVALFQFQDRADQFG